MFVPGIMDPTTAFSQVNPVYKLTKIEDINLPMQDSLFPLIMLIKWNHVASERQEASAA